MDTAPPGGSEGPNTHPEGAEGRFSGLQWFGLVVGPLAFALMLALPAPEGMKLEAWRTAAVTALVALFWVTEVVPIPVTALLPLVLFPILGIEGISGAAAPYANPMIFLFMGGFMIALAMQRWGLHRRIALNIIRVIGTSPRRIILGFMVSAAFLSAWVSNTATTLMMLPIGLSVIELARPAKDDREGERECRRFGLVLMLSIAYASSIGGLATLIGTPTNALLAGFMSETYGVEIGFAQWMLMGVPVVALGIPIAHLTLTRLVFPVRLKTLPGGREYVDGELARLGPLTRPEALVAVVFSAVAVLWISQPLIAERLPGVSDTGIAMLGATLLFLLPADFRRGRFLLDWKYAEQLPWGVLILFGGGLTLAAAIQRTGLAVWFGGPLSAVAGWPAWLVVLLVACVLIMLTELTSNSATAASFLPIMTSLAVGIGQNPLLLAVPLVLAASCAFMLPVATPPNAIVYGSGAMTIPQMARAGMGLNVVFALLITLLSYLLVPVVFGVELGVVPGWAAAGR